MQAKSTARFLILCRTRRFRLGRNSVLRPDRDDRDCKDAVYRLLSAICPHSWGKIIDWGTCFLCPDHAWRFEMSEGICINGPKAQMYASPVTARNGHLYAEVPADKTLWV